MVPAWHNADSLGYNPKATGRAIESWGELLNKDFKGRWRCSMCRRSA